MQGVIDVTLVLQAPPPDLDRASRSLVVSCAGCEDARADTHVSTSSSKHGVVHSRLELTRVDPLPTHATLRWNDSRKGSAKDESATSTCDVPLGLMVENTSQIPFGPGPTRPFVRPLAPLEPAAKSLRVALSRVEANRGRLHARSNLRLLARLENTGSTPIQVDRAAFRATVGGQTWTAVDNETARPMKDWGPGMSFCLEDLPEDVALPDHTILRPRERIEGMLCWVSESELKDGVKPTIVYGRPDIFSATVEPKFRSGP